MSRHFTVCLVLQDSAPPGADAPAVVRLRRVLKSLLRAYNFRALQAVLLDPATGAEITTPLEADLEPERRS